MKRNLPQNLLDIEHEADLVGLNYGAANGMGVSIMEPLRNDFLVKLPKEIQAIYDDANNERPPGEWVFDYFWNKPEVSVVVSGMGNMQNVNVGNVCPNAHRESIFLLN